ncbi:MAG: hypothetical protein D6679_11700 [Candidatus Hydrogenedentota bacterium]|nr:MAG: hypothetical protein D6679_11700 [Candidatus Hydrogenedentota bacterium]
MRPERFDLQHGRGGGLESDDLRFPFFVFSFLRPLPDPSHHHFAASGHHTKPLPLSLVIMVPLGLTGKGGREKDLPKPANSDLRKPKNLEYPPAGIGMSPQELQPVAR